MGGERQKNPVIAVRVDPRYLERYNKVLEELRRRERLASKSDLARILLGDETRIELRAEEVAFLRGEIDSLHGSFLAVPKDPARHKRGRGKN